MGFVKLHQRCDDCGSSDALSYNDDGSSYCFACAKFTPSESTGTGEISQLKDKVVPSGGFDRSLFSEPFKGYQDRCLTAQTMAAFNVAQKSGNVHFGYHTDTGELTAVKTRYPDKTFKISGDWKKASLFGQHLFPQGGQYVTVVEGEFDALAAYQMFGGKYPVVSIRNGAHGAAADCRRAYDFLDNFDNIIFCFDNDEQGKKAATECADIFGGKARIYQHGKHKDACDYLIEGDKDDFVKRWWASKTYTPDGMTMLGELRESLKKPLEEAEVRYPYKGLDDMTFGIRPTELVTICAGSGLGKSTFMRELVFSILGQTTDRIGLAFLEEIPDRTARGLIGLQLNKPIHIPGCDYTPEEVDRVFDSLDLDDRVVLWDTWGSNQIENVLARFRYQVKVLGVKTIVLDHISILVSDQNNGDERKALDEIMTKLRMFCQEMQVSMFVVSHLKRPEGKGHEDGAYTSLGQLRGSAAIAQLSDIVLGLERNAQAEDIMVRNTTNIRVLKNRYSGQTGPACSLMYNKDTGRLTEIMS
jgi:twinkle protein